MTHLVCRVEELQEDRRPVVAEWRGAREPEPLGALVPKLDELAVEQQCEAAAEQAVQRAERVAEERWRGAG